MNIHFDVSDVVGKLDKITENLSAGLYNALQEAGEVVRKDAVLNCPVQTGRLRGSITVNVTVPKSAEIDCENYTVRNMEGNSLMREISGDFFELAVGDNIMTVTSSENVTVEVEYNPRYIHNVDTKDFRLDYN